jgi:Dyp-type peroxidase family
MPLDLEKPAAQVDISSPDYVNLLTNLQANIMKAHGRTFTRHLFIRFAAPPAVIKAWIRAQIAPKVTSARAQYDQVIARETNPAADGGTITGFFLSASGYAVMGFDGSKFASRAFRKGMKDQDGSKDAKPATWETGFRGDVHALVTLADSQLATVVAAAAAITASLAGVGTPLTTEEGAVLRRPTGGGNSEPIEHFGYFDGISNPIFTRRDLDGEAQKIPIGPDWDPGAPLSLILAPDPFAGAAADAFGSYLVYRKLGQDVALFNQRVVDLGASLGMNPVLAGAMLVGRFKDGTPVVERDTPTPDLAVSNDFDYDGDGDSFRCPAHAHIRKANPRGTTPLTSLASERKRRITRRGIPYGKPVPNLVDPSVPSDPAPGAARGLLFLCFQRNIEKQFEFIQQTWIDNPSFPNLLGGSGDDPLIGQDGDEGQKWPKVWGNKNGGKKRVNVESAVTLKGGEYFFAPSMAFIAAQ